jgi:hypothetical protein
MKDTQVRGYEMLQRVGDFGATHAASFPSNTLGGELFVAVNASLSELNDHQTRQASGAGSAKQATASRSEARDELRRDLEAISRTARSMAETIPGLDDKFRLPRGRTSDQILIGTARAFAEDAVPLKAEFIRHEMDAKFLEDLNADITAFEQAVNAQNVNVEKRVTATAAIENAMENGMKAVRRLDAIIRNKFENDPSTLAAWTSTSHIERNPRRTPKTTKPPAPTP